MAGTDVNFMHSRDAAAAGRPDRTALVLLLAMLACAIYFYARNAGLSLSVPDEWVYSRSARLIPLREVGIPSYLYLGLFGGTNVCGSGFLDCARMLNILAMVGAMPFIYLICRRVSSKSWSLLVALLAVLSPMNIYTAFFMPESVYLLLFWVLAWFALSGVSMRQAAYGAGLGAIVGIMGLVKAHAVFLVPALVAFLAFRLFVRKSNDPVRQTLVSLVAFFVAALVVRFGLGYLFGGKSGLSLFGPIYGSVAPPVDDPDRYWRLVSVGLVSLKGHALALAALLALPIAAVFYFPKRIEGAAGTGDAQNEIRLFTFFIFACLLAMTTLFSASVAGTNPMETVARLHMRYYNFALPLVLIVLAQHAAAPSGRNLARALWPALVFGGLAVFAATALLKEFTPWIADSPELRGLVLDPTLFRLIVVLGVLAIAAWVYDTRLGARAFLVVVLPLAFLVSGWNTNAELRRAMKPDVYAQAGAFARQYIGVSREPLIAVGDDHSALYRSMFYVDNPNATNLVLKPGEPVPAERIPADARWLLVVGDHPLPPGARPKAAFGGFALARVGNSDSLDIDFTQGAWPGVVARTQGLSSPEPWGTWSDGTRVVLEFAEPLPPRFSLVLKGHTIGDTDRAMAVVVGGERRDIRLPKPQELTLAYQTDGTARTIEFQIPWAQSMKELGISEDPRKLGIGLVSIRIVSSPPAAVGAPGSPPGA